MANRLNVAEAHSIVALYERGWSCRRIGRVLGIDRETVGNYVRAAQARAAAGAKPAKAPLGSGAMVDGSKPAKAPLGSGGVIGPAEPFATRAAVRLGTADQSASSAGEAGPGRAVATEAGAVAEVPRTHSDCRPYHAVILAKLEQGLSAQRIYQDLTGECGPAPGVAPSYYSIRRYVARLGLASEPALPFRRMECAPGAEMQVDLGRGAAVMAPEGMNRPTSRTGRPRGPSKTYPYVLRVVLSHSRKGYSQTLDRQTTENFIRCLEDAFWHFGGVTQTLVLDNLKAAVKNADWFDPEINPKVQSFCAHYGIVALPTKPRMPRHKGKVERGVDYVQENALKGHQFPSLEAQNRHLWHWEATVADTRIHGTIHQQVKEVFERVERPALRPLPAERFPFFHEAQRIVHRDGHVSVEKAYYSVPPEYLGRTVWARWDGHLVRIFDSRMQLVATHTRKEAGQFSTLNRHILDQKISGVERGAVWLLKKAQAIGPQAERWAQAMVQARGVEGVRVLQGLLSLGNRHAHGQLDRACGVALEHQCFRLRTLRRLVRRDLEKADRQQELPGLLDEHPIIRPLADYGRFVHQAFLDPQPLPRTEIHA
jgi:transposase